MSQNLEQLFLRYFLMQKHGLCDAKGNVFNSCSHHVK